MKVKRNLRILGIHFNNTNNPYKDRSKARALFKRGYRIGSKAFKLGMKASQIVNLSKVFFCAGLLFYGRNRPPEQRLDFLIDALKILTKKKDIFWHILRTELIIFFNNKLLKISSLEDVDTAILKNKKWRDNFSERFKSSAIAEWKDMIEWLMKGKVKPQLTTALREILST